MNAIDKIIKTPGMKSIIFTLIYLCFYACALAFLLFETLKVALQFAAADSIAVKLELGAFALLLNAIHAILGLILLRLVKRLKQEAFERRREFDRQKLENDMGDARARQ